MELEGKERLITACNNVAEEGMVVYTNSPKVRNHRRNTVELILSQHDCLCVTCMRSGNCSLQKIANDLDILEIPFKKELEHQPWNKHFPLIRDSAKCIKCMRCIQVCDKVQGLNIWDLEGTGSRTTVNVAGHKTIEESDCPLCHGKRLNGAALSCKIAGYDISEMCEMELTELKRVLGTEIWKQQKKSRQKAGVIIK